ncbi:MAG: CBS domain-containing protein [Oscillospiraceae bacterium]|nr:CBS domain-containing protein [Oscillospiraceae bacterium]
MNIAYFLTPAQNVISLYDDNTMRKGLDTMRSSGYTSMPVTTRDNIYVGVVSVADFLWYLVPDSADDRGNVNIGSFDGGHVRDIMDCKSNPAVSITASAEELMERILSHNFVPVVDGRGSFVGIVTRRNIMKYYQENRDSFPDKASE